MKKIITSILLIQTVFVFLISFYPIKKIEATGAPTIDKIILTKETQKTNGDKWDWQFDVTTKNATNGSKMTVNLYKGSSKISSNKYTINGNYLNYFTGYILDDQTTYTVGFSIDGTKTPKTYTSTTGKAGQNIKPSISSFSPVEGSVGNTIQINGSNFTGTTEVLIGSVKMTNIVVDSDTKIRAEVGGGTTGGTITVKTPKGSGVSSSGFKITTQPVNIDAQQDSKTGDSTYTLLAPLPGLETAPENVGDYFNIIFKIAIGLCAVLAVIMIVIGGIQYMGKESIFGKAESKGRIGAAILGLIIALGAYALLNTINPDLLGGKGVKIDQVSAGIEEDVTEVGSGVNINGTKVKISKGRAVACKSGIVNNTLGSGKICKDLLDKLKILKSKYPDFKITSTIRGGGAANSCHYEGYANSGNCADLQISNNPRKPSYTKSAGSTNPEWGTFCVAVAQVTGLNYLNEASSVANCQNIQKYKAYPQTSGPHLHVNLISN